MKILSVAKITVKSMWANKARTSLTILGFVIGIASVIIVFSAGEGIKGLVFGQIEGFGGTDVIETEIKVPTGKKGAAAEQQSGAAIAQGVQITTLTIEDMEDVRRLPNIIDGYAAILGQEIVSYGTEQKSTYIYGVSGTYLNIDKSEIDHGRFFTEAEDKSQAMVAVIGPKIKEKFFGDSDAVGKYIKIRKLKFYVIGVMKEKGAVFGFDYDNMVYVPVRTLQKRVMGINHILFMFHKLKDVSLANETTEEARLIIRENHDLESIPAFLLPGADAFSSIGQGATDISKDDFRVVTMQESMDILSTVTGAITILLLAIVAISLIVGGVGIMNIMYVVVTERTAEIGLRKAIGAKYKDIMQQFLIESVLITILGGIFGIIFGIIASLLVYWGAVTYGLDWKFAIPARAFVVSLGFSAVFGLAFGLYPARKAARLDPIEALRAE